MLGKFVFDYFRAKFSRHIFEEELKMARALNDVEKCTLNGIKKNIFIEKSYLYQGMGYFTTQRDFKINREDVKNENSEEYIAELAKFKSQVEKLEEGASVYVDQFYTALGKVLIFRNMYLILSLVAKAIVLQDKPKKDAFTLFKQFKEKSINSRIGHLDNMPFNNA